MRLENGWTGGQYSTYRFLFGCYLCIHFLALVPWGAELFSRAGAGKKLRSPRNESEKVDTKIAAEKKTVGAVLAARPAVL